jgi:hypothetical protein
MLNCLSWYICTEYSEKLAVLIFSLEATSFSTTSAHACRTKDIIPERTISFLCSFDSLRRIILKVLPETESGKLSNLGGMCECYTRISSVPFLLNRIYTYSEAASRQYVWFKAKWQQEKRVMQDCSNHIDINCRTHATTSGFSPKTWKVKLYLLGTETK